MALTQADKDKYLEALEKCSGIVSNASFATGICRSTHYKWLQTDPEYKAKVDEMVNLLLDLAETTITQNMRNGDTAAAIFVLRYRGKSRGYIEKQEIDLQVSDHTIKFEFGPQLTEHPDNLQIDNIPDE